MALDDDDIKKLDKHIVEPLLEGIEAIADRLGDRIDAVGERLTSRIDGLETKVDALVDGLDTKVDVLDTKVDVLDTKVDRLDVRVEAVGNQLLELQADSNRTLGEILVEQRAGRALQEGLNRWMTIEREEIRGRLNALEAWRTEVEKKTRH